MRIPLGEGLDFDLSTIKEAVRGEKRLVYERVLLGVLYTGLGLTVAGSLVASLTALLPFLDPALAFKVAMWTASAGLLLLGLAVGIGRPLDGLRRVHAEVMGGSTYERRKHWTHLKSSAVLLSLLASIAGVVLFLSLLPVLGAEPIQPPEGLEFERIVMILVAILAVNLVYAYRVSMWIPQDEASEGIENAFFLLSLGLTGVAVMIAVFIAGRPVDAPMVGDLVPGHASLFALTAITAISVAAFIDRKMPTVTALFLEEREYRRAGGYMTRRKSIIMPTVIAFALLFGVLLVLLIFQLGVVGDVQELPSNTLLFTVVGLISLALVGSVVASWWLSRTEEETSFYERLSSPEEKREIAVIVTSIVGALFFLTLAAFVYAGKDPPLLDLSQKRWVELFSLGLLAGVGPYGFYYSRRAKRIRALEERFPDFLRDLAASRKAGLTLENGVRIAARGEYGALTPDIQKMADQLSWNVPFEEALTRFRDRVGTPLVMRACSLINEAGRSGGNVTDVLEAAAIDAREIKSLENERRLTMSLYTVVVYIAFFVFLAVAAVLYGQFVPEVLKTTQAVSTQQGAPGAGLRFGAEGLGLADYRTFFFLASIMQGLGNGILAGQMESGKPLFGLRHSFVMVLVTLLLFAVFLP